MNKVKTFIKNLIRTIYPKKCICCGEIIDENQSLCLRCNDKIERINLDEICIECGSEKDDCRCKYNIYRFAAAVCAFWRATSMNPRV